MGWAKEEKLHCHDWLPKCHKFSECGGKVMLGAALPLLSGCWTAFIIWHERRGERRWIGTMPLIISFPSCLREDEGKAPTSTQSRRTLQVSLGSVCRLLSNSLMTNTHCCVLASQQVAWHYYCPKTVCHPLEGLTKQIWSSISCLLCGVSH